MSRSAIAAAVLALLLLTLLPISRALVTSVLVEDAPNAPIELTTEHFKTAFAPAPVPDADPAATTSSVSLARLRLLGNSVLIGLVSSLLALACGVPFALLITRTDLPGAHVLRATYLIPLVLPPLLVAFAWSVIPALEPPKLTAAREPSAWGGVTAVLRASALFALCYFPIVVLFARRALLRVPASLEESARLAGGPWRTLRRVTLPIAAPGMLAGSLFVFLFALNDFAVVDYLNWVRPTDQQINVYPFESFVAWAQSKGPGVATALGVPLALLGVGLLWLIHRTFSRGPRSAVGGDFRPPQPFRLGPWRIPALVAAAALVAISVLVPVGALVWKAGNSRSYRAVWAVVAGSDSATHEVQWTLWFATLAAVISLPLAFVIAHRAVRTGRMRLVALALLPLALPPVFLGAGYLRLLNHPALVDFLGGSNPFLDPDSPRYGPVLLMVAKYLPFAIAALWAAFLEIDPRLEEAAATAGVRPLARALGVLEPLVRPALALAFALVFVLCLREIDTIVLLASDTVMRKIYTMIHFQRDAQVAALCVLLILLQAIPFTVLWILSPRPRYAAR